jgi:hypothetical protein
MTGRETRIAMWSGPRNISTALMRSWGNRPDTIVCDEPLYAHYLRRTGLPHPGAAETLAAHDDDWRRVVAWLTGPLPAGKSIFYQKHMAHHLLPDIELDWLDQLAHVFLIRQPREMLASLVEFIPEPTIDDTGLPQQLLIYRHVTERTGQAAPVIDSRDVLENPRSMLERLCDLLEAPFTEAMLSWPPGRRETDGAWARHWYASVEKTTGFAPYQPSSRPLPDHLLGLLDRCQTLYDQLAAQRLTA